MGTGKSFPLYPADVDLIAIDFSPKMLAQAMESGRILELARVRRAPPLYDLAFSALTADLIRAEAGR